MKRTFKPFRSFNPKHFDLKNFNLKQWAVKNPNIIRRGFNIWPPFLFSGIYVESIAPDFKSAKLKLSWSVFTKNINGTQYGGSLFSMTDPIYVTLLFGIFGDEKYYIWDKEVNIQYKRPGLGPVYYEPTISDSLIKEIADKTAEGEKFEFTLKDPLKDDKGEIIAVVERTIYIRLKPKYRP